MTIDSGRLDEAARAGWLYYVAGNTQDQIASKLGISRQSAQRLVSLAVSEGLVKVRIDHPIAACMDMARRVREQFGLTFCEIVPTDPKSDSTTLGVAEAAAVEIENWLRRKDPVTMALGTGRTLKAAVEQLPPMACPHHTVVSLTGNISPDGSAAYYNVVFTMADTIQSRSFPMPLPVIASSRDERDMLQRQAMIRPTLELAQTADVTFVGVGDLGDAAPLLLDGFITRKDLQALRKAGAVGEIVGWAFDRQGRLLDGLTNDRVASARIPDPARSLVIATAKGEKKLPGVAAAIHGRLINGLISDEATAQQLLAL